MALWHGNAFPVNGSHKGRVICPDIKVHGANMGPIWGRQDPGGPHVGPTNFAIWVVRSFDVSFIASFNELLYPMSWDPNHPYNLTAMVSVDYL